MPDDVHPPLPHPLLPPPRRHFVFVERRESTAVAISPQLFLFFFKTGLLIFGSGLVIVPFLKAQVVDQYHWLTMQQFLDSVAVGMISPGPVVIYRDSRFVRGFIRGVASAVVGVLVATTWLIARSAVVDVLTLSLAIAALIIVAFTKTPEPAVIATAGVIGLIVSL